MRGSVWPACRHVLAVPGGTEKPNARLWLQSPRRHWAGRVGEPGTREEAQSPERRRSHGHRFHAQVSEAKPHFPVKDSLVKSVWVSQISDALVLAADLCNGGGCGESRGRSVQAAPWTDGDPRPLRDSRGFAGRSCRNGGSGRAASTGRALSPACGGKEPPPGVHGAAVAERWWL